MIMIKCLTGSWCTSHRFKEVSLLTCVFGCDRAKDHYSHYLYCPILWSKIGAATRTQVPSHPLGRLGILPPHPGHMLCTLVAFSTYHDVKLSKAHPSATNTAVALALRTTSWTARAVAKDGLKLLQVDIDSLISSSSSESSDDEHSASHDNHMTPTSTLSHIPS